MSFGTPEVSQGSLWTDRDIGTDLVLVTDVKKDGTIWIIFYSTFGLYTPLTSIQADAILAAYKRVDD